MNWLFWTCLEFFYVDLLFDFEENAEGQDVNSAPNTGANIGRCVIALSDGNGRNLSIDYRIIRNWKIRNRWKSNFTPKERARRPRKTLPIAGKSLFILFNWIDWFGEHSTDQFTSNVYTLCLKCFFLEDIYDRLIESYLPRPASYHHQPPKSNVLVSLSSVFNAQRNTIPILFCSFVYKSCILVPSYRLFLS